MTLVCVVGFFLCSVLVFILASNNHYMDKKLNRLIEEHIKLTEIVNINAHASNENAEIWNQNDRVIFNKLTDISKRQLPGFLPGDEWKLGPQDPEEDE